MTDRCGEFRHLYGVLLRPAPLEEIDRLMMVRETDRKSGTVREGVPS